LKIKENRRMKEINRENGMFLHILMYWEMWIIGWKYVMKVLY
jgi:hypothetical protein